MTNQISIPGRYDSILKACNFVVSGAESAGFGPDELFKIELACDEACTNVIEHGYGGEDRGEIRVSWEFSGSAFTITISDDGLPFDPKEVPEPDLPASPKDLDNLKIGGLGIHFMRNLMDEVHFTFDERNRNHLVMIKYVK